MYFRKSLKRRKWMFPFEVKRLIWSALEIKFFKLYFLQPVLGSHPLLSGHLAIPRGWLHNTGSTVDLYMSIKPAPLTAPCISFLAILLTLESNSMQYIQGHWSPPDHCYLLALGLYLVWWKDVISLCIQIFLVFLSINRTT